MLPDSRVEGRYPRDIHTPPAQRRSKPRGAESAYRVLKCNRRLSSPPLRPRKRSESARREALPDARSHGVLRVKALQCILCNAAFEIHGRTEDVHT